jgi:L,D-transpeptidase catalytic domain
MRLGARALVLAVLALGALLPATAQASRAHAKPVHASARLYLGGLFFLHGQAVTVPGRGFTVGGVVRPYAANQWVTVRALLNGRAWTVGRFRLRRSRNGTYGHFTAHLKSPGVGNVAVYVRHRRSTAMARWVAGRGLAALGTSAGFGSLGRFVELIQQRLAAMHFYIPQTGVYDSGTGWAIDAYHRLLHWGTSQVLDGRTVSFLLDGFGAFPVRDARAGRHAEGNLSLQLLALIDGSKVQTIYPISSGKPSTPTILGHFSVYSKTPGYLPDGMYYSNFFFGGYAIHGYNPAPDYPASHGCMRVPIPDAISIYSWLQVGNVVDTYY